LKTFVISDTHFNHEFIIKACNRPFSNVEEMNYTLINNWNSVVDDDDLVYHLGDFGWGGITKLLGIFTQLKGKKILIKGNHDPLKVTLMGWQSVHDYLEIEHNEKDVVLFHYPIEQWHSSHHGSIHLFGHVHVNPVPPVFYPGFGVQPKRHNVCVELINYTPRLLDFYTNEK